MTASGDTMNNPPKVRRSSMIISKKEVGSSEEYFEKLRSRSSFFKRHPPRTIPVFHGDEIKTGVRVGQGQYGTVSEVIDIEGDFGDLPPFSHGTLGSSSSKDMTSVDDHKSLHGAFVNFERSILDKITLGDLSETESIESFAEGDESFKLSEKNVLAQTVRRDSEVGRYRYAVKRLKSSLANSKRLAHGASDLAKEACFLASISHPNIVRLRAMVGAPGTKDHMLVMDRLYDTVAERIERWRTENKNQWIPSFFCSGRSLRQELPTRVSIAYDMARAFRYLHKNRIIHRDLKPDNAAFTVRDDVRLFDFGLARELEAKMLVSGEDEYKCTGMTGSPRWMAPEVFLKKLYGFSADTYSFGLFLWNLCSLELPYGPKLTLDTLRHKVVLGKERPAPLSFASAKLNLLMSRCWSHVPSERPSFNEICDVLGTECLLLNTREDNLNNTRHMMDLSRSSILRGSSEASLLTFDQHTN